MSAIRKLEDISSFIEHGVLEERIAFATYLESIRHSKNASQREIVKSIDVLHGIVAIFNKG